MPIKQCNLTKIVLLVANFCGSDKELLKKLSKIKKTLQPTSQSV